MITFVRNVVSKRKQKKREKNNMQIDHVKTAVWIVHVLAIIPTKAKGKNGHSIISVSKQYLLVGLGNKIDMKLEVGL